MVEGYRQGLSVIDAFEKAYEEITNYNFITIDGLFVTIIDTYSFLNLESIGHIFERVLIHIYL